MLVNLSKYSMSHCPNAVDASDSRWFTAVIVVIGPLSFVAFFATRGAAVLCFHCCLSVVYLGNIPCELGRLQQLQTLYLYDNRLTGAYNRFAWSTLKLGTHIHTRHSALRWSYENPLAYTVFHSDAQQLLNTHFNSDKIFAIISAALVCVCSRLATPQRTSPYSCLLFWVLIDLLLCVALGVIPSQLRQVTTLKGFHVYGNKLVGQCCLLVWPFPELVFIFFDMPVFASADETSEHFWKALGLVFRM